MAFNTSQLCYVAMTLAKTYAIHARCSDLGNLSKCVTPLIIHQKITN